jgi:hypothetical protein
MVATFTGRLKPGGIGWWLVDIMLPLEFGQFEEKQACNA